MSTLLQFFDMSVQTKAPDGYREPLPITLGPNWQPNDLRLAFITASGQSGESSLEMVMNPDPPTGFAAAYSLNPGHETHGVYYRRLASGDADNVSVNWSKPTGWQHFMFALLTVRGVNPSSTPSGGWLKLNQTEGDTTAVASSVTVPGAGTMVFMAGAVQSPWSDGGPDWSVSLGAPTGWTNLVATDKSGINFYQYSIDPSLIVVAKNFSAAGSTGSVSFPTSRGRPAFTGLYLFLTPAADLSVTLSPV